MIKRIDDQPLLFSHAATVGEIFNARIDRLIAHLRYAQRNAPEMEALTAENIWQPLMVKHI